MGFGHNAVLSVAPQVIDAIQTGKLEHIFLVGGCDGNEPQRKYYSKLYEHMPSSTMVLTLGCGKFRIFDQDFGTLPGTDLPRLLDMGQCEWGGGGREGRVGVTRAGACRSSVVALPSAALCAAPPAYPTPVCADPTSPPRPPLSPAPQATTRTAPWWWPRSWPRCSRRT